MLDAWNEFDHVKTYIGEQWTDPPPAPVVHLVVEQCRTHIARLLRARLLPHRRSWWRVVLRRPHRCARPTVTDVYLDALMEPPSTGGQV